jgi:hypothetical protein
MALLLMTDYSMTRIWVAANVQHSSIGAFTSDRLGVASYFFFFEFQVGGLQRTIAGSEDEMPISVQFEVFWCR